MEAEIENDVLSVTFTSSLPTQKDLTALKLSSPVLLEDHQTFTNSVEVPLKHVVKFIIPEHVICENFSVHRTNDYVALQFGVGRTKKIVLDMNQ